MAEQFMKRLLVTSILAITIIISLPGCDEETKRVTRESNGLVVGFIQKMEKGETTREQEQRFIKACGKVLFEVDRAVRGTKKAEQTRNDILKALQAGVDINPENPLPPVPPKDPLKLD